MRPQLLVCGVLLGALAACGGGSSASGPEKSFSEASGIASALRCHSSFVSQQRFTNYNSGQCTYNGHRTYLVACTEKAGCEQIDDNVDALANEIGDEGGGSKWLIGSDWIISVAAQDVSAAQSVIGGAPFVTTEPT